uniref:Uncharacterized protein n=1 Tax=Aegilops tauschii subsp. strangulata TaxID=200361 RepID=A0A453AVX0_AEGTS
GGNVKEIGHIPMIISRLMDAFLSRSAPSSTDTDQLLRMIAGQELALLAMESANNCLLMLAEPGYVFIKELAVMIRSDMYRYIASSLLRSMCVHARPQLGNSDLNEVSCRIRRGSKLGLRTAEQFVALPEGRRRAASGSSAHRRCRPALRKKSARRKA